MAAVFAYGGVLDFYLNEGGHLTAVKRYRYVLTLWIERFGIRIIMKL